jgi:tetratricopeptide (TPR) repeat protein
MAPNIDTCLSGQPEQNSEVQKAYRNILPLIQKGEPDQAISAMSELTQKYPDFAPAHNDLGVLYYEKGNKEKAFFHYEKANNLNPGNITFQKNIADYYLMETGEIEKSLFIYTRILEDNPMDIETLLAIGHVCLTVQRYEDAAVFYNKVLDLEPWNDIAWKALKSIPQSNFKPPADLSNSIESLSQQVQYCLNSGNQEEAMNILHRVISLFPDHALAYNDLGVLYYRQGNKTKSLYYYQKAVRLDPENSAFQKNLADLYLVELNEVEEALKIYIHVLNKEPSDIETLFALGHICIQLEKFEDAKIFYNRILDVEPWNASAQECLDSLSKP